MYGYVTLLSTPDYLYGVLILNKSLKKYNSIYKLHVMVTENIVEDILIILKENDIEIIKISSINPSQEIVNNNIGRSKNYFNSTFSKLNVLKLDFDKLIYLDSDMLLMTNIDHLFLEPSMSACKDNPQTAMENKEIREKINSGLMIIEPSNILFEKAILYLKNMDLNFNKPLGDQDVLQNCFDWNYLNQGYNIFASDLDYYDEDINIYILHYIRLPKPWYETEDFPYRKYGKIPVKTETAYKKYRSELIEEKYDSRFKIGRN